MRLVGSVFVCLSLIACGSPTDSSPIDDGPGVIRVACAVDVASDRKCSIREAIANAVDGAQTHADCAAGTAESTVVLPSGCTFELAAVDNGEQPDPVGACSGDGLPCRTPRDCAPDQCAAEDWCELSFDVCFDDLDCLQTCELTELPAIGNALPIVTGTVVVEGHGSTLVLKSGGASMRFFEVAEGGSLTLKNVTLSGSTTSGDGGAILVGGALTLSASTVKGSSTTGDGGAIAGGLGASCRITVKASTFDGCRAEGDAGAIQQNDCVLEVDQSTFSRNVSKTAGGAVNCNSSVAACTLTNSTFSGNTADLFGGGAISMFNDGPKTVAQCTFHGNASSSNGGALMASSGAVTVAFSTFSGNECAGDGGGIYNDAALTLATSVLENNVDAGGEAHDVAGTVTSGGYNHIESTPAGYTPATGDVTGASAGLAAPADNGGPTRTLAPTAGSPVVDAVPSGTNGCGTTYGLDQRGNPRPGSGSSNCDKGAVEL